MRVSVGKFCRHPRRTNRSRKLWRLTIPSEDAAIAMIPKNLIKLEGKNASGMLRLSEALEEHDDVQSVYSNFDIDEKELEAMA